MYPDIFVGGQEISLEEALFNKEWRTSILAEMAGEFPGLTRISIKLNIPGPLKNNSYFQKIFLEGLANLMERPVSEQVALVRPTGPEAFWVCQEEAGEIKGRATHFEENFSLGRLFDVDVYGPFGQISRTDLGQPNRLCFVCQESAKVCARESRHSVAEIKYVINKIYGAYFGRSGS